MADRELLEAMQDADAFRHYIEAKLIDAMRAKLQEMHDREDDLLIYGNPPVRLADG